MLWFVLPMQVPMVGKGVVESMLRVLGAVQGGGAEALAVQAAACSTLQNLSIAADNKVRGPVAGRWSMRACGMRVWVGCPRRSICIGVADV